MGMKRFDDAVDALKQGLKLHPNNEGIEMKLAQANAMASLIQSLEAETILAHQSGRKAKAKQNTNKGQNSSFLCVVGELIFLHVDPSKVVREPLCLHIDVDKVIILLYELKRELEVIEEMRVSLYKILKANPAYRSDSSSFVTLKQADENIRKTLSELTFVSSTGTLKQGITISSPL